MTIFYFFLIAMFVTFVYIIPLTFLIVLAPYLQDNSGYCLLRWVTKIKPLLNAYTGPYKDKHRYWTGLMVVARIILFFIIFTGNITKKPNMNLIAIALMVGAILTWQYFSGRIYRSLQNSILETLYLIILGTLTVTTLFIRNLRASQQTLEYITCFFVGATSLVFLFTTVMHITNEVPLVGKLRDRMKKAAGHIYLGVGHKVKAT